MLVTMLGGIHHRFNEVARSRRERIAIRTSSTENTFGQLLDTSNYLAAVLRQSGHVKGQRIGVCAGDHALITASILGILKADCAFVPLDPTLPDERLRQMLALCELSALIIDRDQRDRMRALLGAASVRMIEAEMLGSAAASGLPHDDTAHDFTSVDPDALCSVYFTSGSTGTPRAVAGRLCGIDHHIAWEIDFLALDETGRGSVPAFPYDAYLPDVLVPLCAGGTACVPSAADISDPQRLCTFIERFEITLLHCVPSLFRALLSCPDAPRLKCLRHVLLAGEVLRPADVRAANALWGQRVRLVNLYGPTEATLVKLHHAVTAADAERATVPIGVPMPNVQVHLFSDDGGLVPRGQVGQIAIQSRYGSHGYLNDPQLTRQRFIEASDGSGEQIYLTGDYGCFLDDGNLAFVGRRDRQLKLRGMRVDLDDMEALLGGCDGVLEAAVKTDKDAAGDDIVHGFVILQPGTRLDEVRRQLEQRAAPALRPASLTALPAFPRTMSGKIDRKALHPARAPIAEPRTELEHALAQSFAAVLGLDGVGVNESFFALGGHSLSAARLLARLRERHGIALSLATLFEHSTIEALAPILSVQESASVDGITALPTVEAAGFAPSPEQRSLLMFEGFYPGAPALNIFLIYRLRGNLDVALFERCLSTLHRRHGALRTAFFEMEDCLLARELETPFSLERIDLRHDPTALFAQLDLGLRRSFALDGGCLWAARLLQIADADFYFSIVSHHIASDGRSYTILLRELSALYQTGLQQQPPALAEKQWHYPHYAVWRDEVLRGPRRQRLSDFCAEDVRRSAPPVTLPTDHPRRPGYRFDGDQVRGELAAAQVRALTALGLAHGATLFMTLVAGLLAVLHHATGARRVTMINTAENRERAEHESIVGLFANFILVGADFDDAPSFATLLQRVRQRVLQGLAHQDTPFEFILEQLQTGEEFVVPEIMLTLFGDLALSLPGLSVERVDLGNGTTTHDLMIHAEERDGAILLSVNFRHELFHRDSISRLIDSLRTLLDEAIAAPHVSTGELPIIASGRPLFVKSHRTATEPRQP